MLSLRAKIVGLPDDCINHMIGYTYSPQNDKLLKDIVEEGKKLLLFNSSHRLFSSLKGESFLDVLYCAIVANPDRNYEYNRYEREYLIPRFNGYKNLELMTDILTDSYHGIDHSRTNYKNVCRNVWSLMSLEEIYTHLLPCIKDTVVQQWYECKYWERNIIPLTISMRFSWMFTDGIIKPEYVNTIEFYINYYNNIIV
jgi:hypothetical protein